MRLQKTGLSPPVKYFTDRSKAVLLLWIFYVLVLSDVCYVFVRVCLYVLWGLLPGKGWPLGSRLWCLTVSLSLSHWYLGSGVVLDCIDSWSFHPYLLWMEIRKWCIIIWRGLPSIRGHFPNIHLHCTMARYYIDLKDARKHDIVYGYGSFV